MGVNQEVSYGFGLAGSTYLNGNGSKLVLDGTGALYYIIAVTMIEDTTFASLNMLDGGPNNGIGRTNFISTESTQTLSDDWGAETAQGDNSGTQVSSSKVFPRGVTMYGQWDNVELNGGACICYVAPRPDYRDRA